MYKKIIIMSEENQTILEKVEKMTRLLDAVLVQVRQTDDLILMQEVKLEIDRVIKDSYTKLDKVREQLAFDILEGENFKEYKNYQIKSTVSNRFTLDTKKLTSYFESEQKVKDLFYTHSETKAQLKIIKIY
jgi:hypothetical protein